ncbi:hypothetical protein KSS87_018467, partial [Heliosperma pusillum]
MGSEARKTHCTHKGLQCKQWVMKQGRLIVNTNGVTMQTMGNEVRLTQGVTMQTMGDEARKTHCS